MNSYYSNFWYKYNDKLKSVHQYIENQNKHRNTSNVKFIQPTAYSTGSTSTIRQKNVT